MMPIGGMNVPIVITPSTTPSMTSEWNQDCVACGPNHENTTSMSAVSQSRTGPSTQSCAGPASVVVASNMPSMIARKMRTPSTGCSSTRSMRSENVTRSRALVPRPSNTRAAQSKRSSAPSSTQRCTSTCRGSIVSSPSGSGVPPRLAATVSISSRPPSPVRPLTGTTGTPSNVRDSSAASMPVPCLEARSFIVRATTVGRPSSSTIDRKYKAREMFVASSTATMRSGAASPLMPITASAATRSSGESGSSE